MSDQNQKSPNPNAPLIVFRGGKKKEVFVKIWGNETKEGKQWYSTSVGLTFTDAETGLPRDTNSLSQSEMNELPRLINRANQTLRLLNDPRVSRDQALNPDRQTVDMDLKAQRDAVIAKAKAPSVSNGAARSSGPDMEAHTPEM